MKKFVNKTKQMKRVVVYEDKDMSTTKTYFLRRGQELSTSLTPKYVEDGVMEVGTSNTTKTTKATDEQNKDTKE